MRMTRLDATRRDGIKRLSPFSDSPDVDTDVLLMHVLQCSRAFLYSHQDDELSKEEHDAFYHCIQQRQKGMPIAYLTGQREFWSLSLHVNNATLIPRPETELLVETVHNFLTTTPHARILELGTGSGAIALALASMHPTWCITASDISKNALHIAQRNAEQLGFKHVHFHESNWFCAIPQTSFDAIVSNPPYLSDSDPHLQQGDLRFEPHTALASGHDGLDAIREIIQTSPHYLKPGGYLFLEHGSTQAEPIRALMQARGFNAIHTLTDLQQHPRLSYGSWIEGQA